MLTRASSRLNVKKKRFFCTKSPFFPDKIKLFVLEILFLFHFIGNVTIIKFYSNHFFVKTFIFEDIYYLLLCCRVCFLFINLLIVLSYYYIFISVFLTLYFYLSDYTLPAFFFNFTLLYCVDDICFSFFYLLTQQTAALFLLF